MKTIAVLIFIFAMAGINLFPYGIEQITVTFIDTDRGNRQIPTQIFIPVDNESTLESDNREELFPFIVFGHGWTQSYSVYQSVWEALVPLGWIMVFPTTEGGLFPSHHNFALDLAFLSFALPAAGSDIAFPLYNLVDSLSVVMGHSMGGGCSIVAASYENNFSSVVTFAAAETTPSAIDAAAGIEMPSITFSGTSDWVTPPESHQIPIYNNLGSAYKSFVSLNGVGHSGIYNNDTVFSLLEPWLSFMITYDMGFITEFEDLLDFYDNEELLTYLIELTLVPPQELTALIDNGFLILSWEKILFASHYVIQSSQNINDEFVDVSQEGIFGETGERAFWAVELLENEPYRFFKIQSANNGNQVLRR